MVRNPRPPELHEIRKPELTLRLPKGSWALLGRVSALGVRVRDLTTRVQEP